MQPFTILVALLTSTLSATHVFAQTPEQIAYSAVYDNAATPLDTVACSFQSGGYEPTDYTTFGSLPDFPFIGGAAVVAGWNSPYCGTCWVLTYQGSNVTILVIDTAQSGFNISEEAFNALTDGEPIEGPVTAEVLQVDASRCGL